MSKSLGNVLAPQELFDRYGADVVRLWVAATDYRGDLRISGEILGQIVEVYRRIRNTARFLLGNLHDFDPRRDAVPAEAMSDLDRWATGRAAKLMQRGIEAYRTFEFHLLYHALHNFCAVEMGGFYLDVLKDLLYCEEADSPARRSAQTALLHILQVIVRLAAPILPFTAEEIWEHMPEGAKEAESVHLTRWEDLSLPAVDEALMQRWERFLYWRRAVSRALEAARAEKTIGASTEASVEIYPNELAAKELAPFADELPRLLMVAEAALHPADAPRPEGASSGADEEIAVVVQASSLAKCERCWRRMADVGADASHPSLCGRCVQVVAKV